VLSLPLIPLGLATAWAFGGVTHVSIEQSLFGILIGGGTLLVVTYGYFAITGREGMGLGDYRLMAGVGAFLGWQSLLFLLIASAIQGLVFAGIVKVFRLEGALPRLDDPLPAGFTDGAEADEPASPEPTAEAEGPPALAVPFGPFIALAALEWLLFEPLWMKLQMTWVFGMGS
jgi:prepilin signal peptidase PulO-like enzyme (type II secretory pathway)